VRDVPRSTARELTAGERLALAAVGALGLAGIAGSLIVAWWLALAAR
jgi:hypothetical protein